MKVETLVVGPFEVNCYMVWKDPAQTLVIDPGDDADRIVEVLEKQALTPAAYLLTHGHVDHISALAAVSRRWPAAIYTHADTMKWAFKPVNQLPPYYAAPVKPEGPVMPVEEAQVLMLGELNFSILHTPGHSPDSICWYLPDEQVLFSGDTLFKGSVGRTDLTAGDSRQLMASLTRLSGLPDQVRVYPGHGPATSVGQEKRSNFFLRKPGNVL